jgi:hypothetical protein
MCGNHWRVVDCIEECESISSYILLKEIAMDRYCRDCEYLVVEKASRQSHVIPTCKADIDRNPELKNMFGNCLDFKKTNSIRSKVNECFFKYMKAKR